MSSNSDEDLRKALRHVYYELWMLFSIGGRIIDAIVAGDEDSEESESESQGYHAFTHTSPPPQVSIWEVPTPVDVVAKNATVESFAIHTRALLQFFFSEEFRTLGTDTVADEFFDSSESWRKIRAQDWDDELAELRDRVGREIAHITSFRNVYPIEDKLWSVREILLEIAGLAKRFLDAVPEHFRPDGWSLEAEIDEILGSA